MENAVGSMVSVLCARVRVEEKRLIEALAAAGVPSAALPPCSEPMPLGPSPLQPFAAGLANGAATKVVFDRCQDRAVAAALLPLLKANGATVIDAGIAATGDRLAVVSALNRAGVARPQTLLVTSEATGLAAFDALGVPSTLLPLDPGSSGIVLRDREIAEAVFEHRNVLGGSKDAVALLQQGVAEEGRLLVLVAGGKAVAIDGELDGARCGQAVELARAAAAALRAAYVAIEVASGDGRLVGWDVPPTPEYRNMRPLTARSIESALRELLVGGDESEFADGVHVAALIRREALDGAVLSA
jgi:glutathione synthase/RimK-type ligase-like ATP-grasp enzyme